MRQDYSYYETDLRDCIAIIRFRHQGVDACTRSHAEETADLVADVEQDPDVHVAVLVGTGERFAPTRPASGVGSAAAEVDPVKAYAAGRSFVHALVNMEKPLVAALNGDALLIGLTIALLSDIVIAERHIHLRDAHVPLGVPASTGPFIWPVSTGLLRAKRYILTGEEISATEAERIGLVTEVVERGESERRAMEYATTLAAMQPDALRYTKRALNETLRSGLAPRFDAALGAEHLSKGASAR